MWGLIDPDCPVDMQKLTASVKAHEGLRLKMYKDTTNHWSIGYGRNLEIGISADEAEFMLFNDLNRAISSAQVQPWWPNVKDNDARARACIECIFNLGANRFAQFTKATAALCDGDFATAGEELLDSLWHQQVGERSRILAKMISTGEDATN